MKIRQLLCSHHVVKCSEEEYKSTNYAFKCSKCGKYIDWEFRREFWEDYRFWIGVLWGILAFQFLLSLLIWIVKGW